jgi:AraC family ethanolamine operon transcriptional activator
MWKTLRLNAARRELTSGAPGSTVTGAAMRSGHLHLGRFAIEYREQFGESPSATLRRARPRAATSARHQARERSAIG